MKKLSSMLALGMALALTFGMTVSAAESPATQNPDFKPTANETQVAESVLAGAVPEVKAPAGVTVTVEKPDVNTVAEVVRGDVVDDAIADFLKDSDYEKKMDKLAANAGAADKKVRFEIDQTPVAAVEIKCDEIPAGGLTVEIANANIQPNSTTTYVVMHLNSETGKWEIIVPDKVENGKVTVTFMNLSPSTINPTIIVPVGEEKTEEEPAKEEWLEPRHPEQAAAAAAANPATSPKTAETLPMAGVMALIGLAGAAICASKVRYNK